MVRTVIFLMLMAGAVAQAQEKAVSSWGPSLYGPNAAATAAAPAKQAPKVETPQRTPKLAKRRPVRSEPITMPAAPQVRSTAAVPTTPVPAPVVAVPPAPIPLVGCDAAGNCRDAAGRQLQGGVGTTLLDANGRACVRHGAWVQC